MWPHGLQHARLPCSSTTPRAYSNSCPLCQWCHPSSHPVSFSSPPVFNLSKHQGLCQWVSSLHQVAKVLEFQLQHQSFQWIFRTDFLMMDWLDLLAVQGTLKSLLQHHSSKASIFWCSVQSLSRVQLFVTPWTLGQQAFPVHHQLLEFTQTHVHWVGDAIQPSHPPLPPSPPAPNLSQHQGLFQWVNSLHEVAKVLEFQLQHQSFQWTPRTDLFRMDWLDLLAVQGTLKSLLQHHSSKASILQCSALYSSTLRSIHDYWKNPSLDYWKKNWTFVGKVMSLLLNLLFRLVVAFLPSTKRLLISWLQSPSAVILEPRKIKSATVSTVSPSICHEVMGLDAKILVFWMLSFKPTFSLSFTFIKRLFSSFSLSAIWVVSSVYLRLLIFLPAILIPVCASSSLAFHIMSSAYKLNKHSDNIQPWLTPCLIWNQSVFPCPFLTVTSWPAYRILKSQVRWSGIPIFWRIFHSLLWSTLLKALA